MERAPEYQRSILALQHIAADLDNELASVRAAISALKAAATKEHVADEKRLLRLRIEEFGSQAKYAKHLGISQARVSGMLGWKTKPLPDAVRRDLGIPE